MCPMVAGFVEKHHEFADVVDPVDRRQTLAGEFLAELARYRRSR